MKKRLFALTTALILTFGMTVSVCAAPSASTDTTSTTVVAISVDQAITDAQAASFATSTTVETTVAGTQIKAVSGSLATTAASKAKELVGSNAAIATVVDLIVPEGTGAADFTLKVPTVKAGQRIVVLHQKKDGTWEKITPKSVVNGAVTFTLSSYSPVAIVIENSSETATPGKTGTAPKTGDAMALVALMAAACLAGTIVFSKKAAK